MVTFAETMRDASFGRVEAAAYVPVLFWMGRVGVEREAFAGAKTPTKVYLV
jgi:hypothetical protein